MRASRARACASLRLLACALRCGWPGLMCCAFCVFSRRLSVCAMCRGMMSLATTLHTTLPAATHQPPPPAPPPLESLNFMSEPKASG